MRIWKKKKIPDLHWSCCTAIVGNDQKVPRKSEASTVLAKTWHYNGALLWKHTDSVKREEYVAEGKLALQSPWATLHYLLWSRKQVNTQNPYTNCIKNGQNRF